MNPLLLTGIEDNMKCFYCGTSIRHWSETTNPYVEHAKLVPNCGYVILRMSDSFVQDVQQMTPHHPSDVQSMNHGNMAVSIITSFFYPLSFQQ